MRDYLVVQNAIPFVLFVWHLLTETQVFDNYNL